MKVIPEVEAKKFLKKLTLVGFVGKNKNFLSKYMNKNEDNTGVALSHIKANYFKFVIKEGWTERKYADITFIIARKKQLFSKENYSTYGEKYENREIDNYVITERSEYKIRKRE